MSIKGTHTTERYDQNDVEYIIEVDFEYVQDDGSYYEPPYEEVKTEAIRLVYVDGQAYASNQPLPDWIYDDETLLEDLDIADHV